MAKGGGYGGSSYFGYTPNYGIGGTEATGIAKAVETITHAVGIQDCGCKKRQEQLNQLFPYNNEGLEK